MPKAQELSLSKKNELNHLNDNLDHTQNANHIPKI